MAFERWIENEGKRKKQVAIASDVSACGGGDRIKPRVKPKA